MSFLEGCATMEKFCQRAKKLGHPAISFAEAGTLRGCVEFSIIAKREGVKPIFGLTVSVCGDMNRRGVTQEERTFITANIRPSQYADAIRKYEIENGIAERDSLTLWAITQAGLKNLYRISSLSWMDGFYYTPRVDIKCVIDNNEGRAVGTGDMTSTIHRKAGAGRRRKAFEVADRLWEAFGPERFWVELQPHNILEQAEANEFALALLQRYSGSRPLATQGARYLNEGDHKYQRMLAAIGADKDAELDDCGLPGDSYWFKTRAEMKAAFAEFHPAVPVGVVRVALDNTVRFAESTTAVIEPDKFTFDLPDVHVPEEYNDDVEDYIKDLCLEGWTWRNVPDRIAAYAKRRDMEVSAAQKVYFGRLKMELTALKTQGFTKYILMVRELYAWTRAQKIMGGPGRGSAAGSIVNWLLGITSVDPVEYGLLFERFINPNRIDMPDIDMDFEDARRQEVIEHLRAKYGFDYVSQIATWGNLKGKSAIRDVGRVLRIPMAEVSLVTNAVLERSSGDERASMTVLDSFDKFTVCQNFDKKYPEVREYCSQVEGLAKNVGIHAAGVICSPRKLIDFVPLETRKDPHGDGRLVVTAPPMQGAASLGLVKMDVLGLRTMTILRLAVEEIARRHGTEIDLEHVNLDDEATLQGFTDHSYTGVFQYDSVSADSVCRGVTFTQFEDVIAMTALNRPGTSRSGLATKYVARKKDPRLVEKVDMHPSVSRITSDALGIIVYQEHVIKIFIEVAGFHPGTADSLRSKIAKRWGEETLGREREKFIKGAMETTPGMTEQAAGKIMDAITFFGSYGFNKSHATSYGMVAYWCMYVKVHYPIEFFVANLRCQADYQKLQAIVRDAKAHGVRILPPDVSRSGVEFKIDDDESAIRGSLVDIKGCGAKAAASIMKNAPYVDIWDFLGRVDRRSVNKGVVLSLARAGALAGVIPNLKFFIERFDKLNPEDEGCKNGLWDLIKKSGKVVDGVWTWNDEKRIVLERILSASAKCPDYSDEERILVASKVNPLAFGKHPIDAYDKFIERSVSPPISSIGGDDFFEKFDSSRSGGCWVAGVLVAIKLNQIGDFHNGEDPTPDEMKRMGWGKRYANVNIEDASGVQRRCKIDWDIYDAHWHLIDSGVGTPVIAHVSVNGKFETMRTHFMINLEEYRKRTLVGAELGLWERIVAGKHPSIVRKWKSDALRKTALVDLEAVKKKARNIAKKSGNSVTIRALGVITNVRVKPDKKMNNMGFFGVVASKGFIDCMCWASYWGDINNAIKVGNLVSIDLEYERGLGIYAGGRVRLIQASC
jgi:DNA polymerase-3 subunit alpha